MHQHRCSFANFCGEDAWEVFLWWLLKAMFVQVKGEPGLWIFLEAFCSQTWVLLVSIIIPPTLLSEMFLGLLDLYLTSIPAIFSSNWGNISQKAAFPYSYSLLLLCGGQSHLSSGSCLETMQLGNHGCWLLFKCVASCFWRLSVKIWAWINPFFECEAPGAESQE